MPKISISKAKLVEMYGSAMSIEQRIQEIIKEVDFSKDYVEIEEGGVICHSEKELREALLNKEG